MNDNVERLEKLEMLIQFKNKLKKRDFQNSTEIAIYTANLFKSLVNGKWWKQLDELLATLRDLGKNIISIYKLEFSVGNVNKRILFIIREEKLKLSYTIDSLDNPTKSDMVFQITPLNDVISYSNIKITTIKRLSSKMMNYDFDTLESKDIILNNISEVIIELESITEEINAQAVDLINNNYVILTSNYSRQLATFFQEAAKTRSFQVIIAESSPKYNGLKFAKELADDEIKTITISDTSVFAFMPRVNKVIIGTRVIMANGWLISYDGVYNACLAAQTLSIPAIVVGGTFKLCPMYPFDHSTFNTLLSPFSLMKPSWIDEDINSIIYYTSAYDYVPPEFISIYITNHGSQNPAYIYRLFSEFYSQEDYFL